MGFNRMNAVSLFSKTAATEAVLRGAWKRIKANGFKGGPAVIKKNVGSFSPVNKELRSMGFNPKIGKTEAMTLGERKGNVAKGTMMIKGQSIKGADASYKQATGKGLNIPKKDRAATLRGKNAITNMHEYTERQGVKKGIATRLGGALGHSSVSNVLGNEHNIGVTGDNIIRKGFEVTKKVRKVRGDEKAFNRLALKDKNGNKPITFGNGGRISKAYKFRMLLKEHGLPSTASKKDLHDLLKGKQSPRGTVKKSVKSNVIDTEVVDSPKKQLLLPNKKSNQKLLGSPASHKLLNKTAMMMRRRLGEKR